MDINSHRAGTDADMDGYPLTSTVPGGDQLSSVDPAPQKPNCPVSSVGTLSYNKC